MNALCQERGIAFLVAVFPDESSYSGQSDLADRLMRTLRKHRVTVVDMAARFRARGLRFDEVAFDRIGHLTPRGHSVASQVLEAEITARRATLARGRGPREGD